MCLKRLSGIIARLKSGVAQMHDHKRLDNMKKIQAIFEKYNTDNEDQLRLLEKELTLKLKFLQLAHPKVSFEIDEEDVKEQEKKSLAWEMEYETLNRNKDPLVYPNPREEVMFTNWAEGNVDPDDVKRHKRLLDRQHFKSPEWENSPLPSLSAMDYLKSINISKQVTELDPQIFAHGDVKNTKTQETNDNDRWETFRR